jgi:hypothetical protein
MMRVRLATAALVVLTAACSSPAPEPDAGEPTPTSADPTPSPSPTEPILTLDDISVSEGAQANRDGLLLCGDRIVAAPPVSFIENNAFAVFDETSGVGELSHVELPPGSGLQENARWLLVMRCVDSPAVTPNGPVLSFAYQEMPLPETGGVGVRGAYSLDGQLLWMRDDLNQPAELVDGLLVLGVDMAQPDRIVDAVTGESLRTFKSALGTRIVLTHDRILVRGPDGRPVLTDVEGKRIATLRTSGSFFADSGIIFGVNFRDVVAHRSQGGRRLWSFPIRLDPLSTPRVDRSAGVAVLVDHEYVAHGIDLQTGRELWRHQTEVENPRVTMTSGLVLLDQGEEQYQVLLDARTGAVLPEYPERIIDLKPAGALVILDGTATIVPPRELRKPPPSATDDATD